MNNNNHALKSKRSHLGPEAMFGHLADGMSALGSLVIFGMMLLVCSDVVLRSLMNRPIYGVNEIMSLSIVAIVFLQLASTLKNNRMARADIFIDKLIRTSPGLGYALRALFGVAGMIAFSFVIYGTYPLWERAWHGSEYIGVPGLLTVPTWPVRMIVILGGILTAIQYAINVKGDVVLAIHSYQEKRG
ncbi:TRAP transporter small permease [Halomonas campisalis]|uniref:TRAP transporter small permease protein n=1 Tax=Billgrantia campisalis TaxID=74661 RepID=A0ABS9PAZ6_9GAMM|nr:TRAP transporter small permease [Halomonas campisalis]MCG6658937.1 TRAP transporter small permease [Halomonas campisalis]MDR5863658.1 TRAP transporter small permease [Halomonas campisalis]